MRRILSPWSSLRARLPFQNLQVEVVQRKAFARARPSKSASWRCENEAFVRVSFKICKLKLCNGSFRARLPSKSASWRCENEAFVEDFRLPSKTALCRGRFFAVIALLQSLFSCSHLSLRSFLFAVIVLCNHCALPSLCFAVMVLCGHGPLQCCKRMHQRDQQTDFFKVGNI